MTTIMEVLNEHNDWAFSLENSAVLCSGCDWSQQIRDIDPAAVVFRNHQAEAIEAAGYVKAEPKWQDTLLNDSEFEYTTTSDCDGSNVRHWKRRPGRTYEDQPHPWEEIHDDSSSS